MKTRQHAIRFLTVLLLSLSTLFAELPPELKPTAEEYDKAQQGFDASVAAQTKMARDGYLLALGMARKREETTKRVDAVLAIDAEIAAVNGGSIEGNPPEKFPADLKNYRDRFVAATKRAATSNDSVRKHSTEGYLKWLTGMEKAAKGKSEGLYNAVLAEKQRVLDAVKKRETGAK